MQRRKNDDTIYMYISQTCCESNLMWAINGVEGRSRGWRDGRDRDE
jgi:hypothetical protein